MGFQTQTKDGNYSKLLKGYLQPASRNLPPAMVRERLFKILKEFISDDKVVLSPNMGLKDDLGLDSLDMVEIIMSCEKDFFTNLPDKEWAKCKTILELEQIIFKSL